MNALLEIGVTNALVATVLALAALLAGKLGRRPALCHALWLLVLLKLITPPLVIFPVAWPANDPPPVAVTPAASPAEQAEAPVAPREAVKVVVEIAVEEEDGENEPPTVAAAPMEERAAPAIPLAPPPVDPASPAPGQVEIADQAPEAAVEIPWGTLLGWSWLLTSAAWFAVALWRIVRFQRLLAPAQPAGAALQQEACALAVRLGLRDCPGVWLMPGKLSPLLWAVSGYPRLLLPLGLLERLDAAQRATLLAHELAHYRRRDHWVRCIEFVALGLYWWFPVLWWARRELREAEEECCDAWVVWALPEAVKAYARALVETLDFLSGSQPALPPVASGLGQLHLLRRRLTMIMRGTTPRMLTGAGFIAVLALAALLLPLWPTVAQHPVQPGQDGQTRTVTGQQPVDIERAKADLKAAADDLARMKANLDKMSAEYEAKIASVKKAVEAVKVLEKSQANPGIKPPMGGAFGGYGPPGMMWGQQWGQSGSTSMHTMEKRLADMEKKLDTVLQELQDLRKQMRKGAGFGPMGPGGGPGGGFVPTPPAPGGAGKPGVDRAPGPQGELRPGGPGGAGFGPGQPPPGQPGLAPAPGGPAK